MLHTVSDAVCIAMRCFVCRFSAVRGRAVFLFEEYGRYHALRKRANEPCAPPRGCYFLSCAKESSQRSALSFALSCRADATSKDEVWKRQQMLTPLAELLRYSRKCRRGNIVLRLCASLHMAKSAEVVSAPIWIIKLVFFVEFRRGTSPAGLVPVKIPTAKQFRKNKFGERISIGTVSTAAL